MATLNSILNIATSGLHAAQAGLDVVSNNVSNVNTAGYVTEILNQSSVSTDGSSAGVQVDGVTRATNAYLESANYTAQSTAAQASVTSSLLTQAQSLLGDPTPTTTANGSTTTTSFFSGLDNVFSSLSTVAASATTSTELAAVNQVSTFLSSAQTVQSGLSTLSGQADQQIQGDVSTANQLLSQISSLNTQISQSNITGQDATGPENQQASLISQLSSLLGVNVSTGANGVVTVRGSDGTLLANGAGAATLSYQVSDGAGAILVTPAQSSDQSVSNISNGELAGLINVRNVQIPGIASQVAGLVNQAATQLNTVANKYSAVPAPTTLTGANTGQDLGTAISNFGTGTTNINIVSSAGVLQNQVTIVFNANGAGTGTISNSSGGSANFTGSNFLSVLNGATGLGSSGASATYTNGALSITSGSASSGVAVTDGSPPAELGGQDFSTFFGLNNLIQSNTITNTNTGLTSASASGFPAGQTISFNILSSTGNTIQKVTATTPAGGTVGNLITALNTSVSSYGQFSLSSTGQLSFQSNSGSNVSLAVASDNTQNGAAASLTQLFGLGAAQKVTASNSYSVRSDILGNPSLLQTAALNTSGAVGSTVLEPGDTTGADALAQAGGNTTTFQAAGGLPATTTTLIQYASQISGAIANASSAAANASTNASSLANEAQSRLSGAEGVNLDSELVSLTTYQQAYSASARLVQASSDLFNTLLTMVGG
jgi:flagellar hook-associated protein 1 FlgK